MIASVSKEGINLIKVTRKPELDYNFMIRADFDALYVPPNLSGLEQIRNLLGIFTDGRVRIEGWKYLIKLVLFGLKEYISMKLAGDTGLLA